MFVQFPGFVYHTTYGQKFTGIAIGFDHIPKLGGWHCGIHGGFAREKDAEIAIKSLKAAYPDFNWDECTREEWDCFSKEQSENKLQSIAVEHLQW